MRKPAVKFLAQALTLVKGMGAALVKVTPAPGRMPVKAKAG
jgi:hypothetical protein